MSKIMQKRVDLLFAECRMSNLSKNSTGYTRTFMYSIAGVCMCNVTITEYMYIQ